MGTRRNTHTSTHLQSEDPDGVHSAKEKNNSEATCKRDWFAFSNTCHRFLEYMHDKVRFAVVVPNVEKKKHISYLCLHKSGTFMVAISDR